MEHFIPFIYKSFISKTYNFGDSRLTEKGVKITKAKLVKQLATQNEYR